LAQTAWHPVAKMIRLDRTPSINEHDMASKNTTLSALNRGGIAALADGSCWHIPSSELSEAQSWRIGAEVMIQGHRLINIETGAQVRVVPIPLTSAR
jgi:hypothetical protein